MDLLISTTKMTFKASAYSPFGALVASIDADSVQEINDEKFESFFWMLCGLACFHFGR